MKRCRLKRYNFQIRNKMSKENKTSDKAQKSNDFIADVSGSFTKDEVINILQKRADNAFHKFHEYERNEILEAIDIITRLIPPSSFPDW